MQKMCHFISDNTSISEPNILTLVQRDDGDIEFNVHVHHSQERGISIRASGSRLREYAKVINLFSQIIDIINSDSRYTDMINERGK